MLLLVPTVEPLPPQAGELDQPLAIGEKVYVHGASGSRAVLLQCMESGALLSLISRTEACFVQSPDNGATVKLVRNKQQQVAFDSELVFGELSAEAPSDNPAIAYLLARAAQQDATEPESQASPSILPNTYAYSKSRLRGKHLQTQTSPQFQPTRSAPAQAWALVRGLPVEAHSWKHTPNAISYPVCSC